MGFLTGPNLQEYSTTPTFNNPRDNLFSMHESGHKYAPSFIQVLLAVFVFGCVCGMLFTAVLESLSRPIPGILSFTFLKILSIIYLWAMICAFVLAQTLAVHVTQAGIRARTFWGVSKSLDWSGIARVERVGFAWLGFLRLHPEAGGGPLWVPLFLKNREGFRAEALSHVSAAHPLAVALAK